MMRPICVPCERFMRCKKNDVTFVEAMPDGSVPLETLQEGKGSPGWKPYKLWAGDLYECPECHTQAIGGVPRLPIAEHYQPQFAEAVKRHRPRFLLKDC